ncbi:MAG: NTP transferase domain-containing protein [Candidatus Lokiarchaeota archaeon]|nr:NTP transferase domain-containing protein [Candidatus Lokiarchaeota archaeon]
MEISEKWSAIILAGGLGSRLMPLTTNICKPMVNVTNKAMIDYAIDHLRFAGIKHIIICVKKFGKLLTKELLERWNPVMEKEPDFKLEIPYNDSHGTADAVRKVWDYIDTDYFVVSMADIVTNLPMKDFMEFHVKKNADATISMKPIDEFATKYGNTVLDNEGKIQLFLEKPSAQEIFLSTLADTAQQEVLPIINTGIYCFKKSIAKQCIMHTNFMDFGKEIFPYLLENRYRLYGFVEKYYWMDVGNPKTYMWANWDILREYGWPIQPQGTDENKKKIWWNGKPIHPPNTTIEKRVCLGKNIFFGDNVKIKSLSVIGNNVKIGDGTVIDRAVIWDDVEIGQNSNIVESVIADGCKIGNNVTLRTDTVLGPNVIVKENVLLDSRTIQAHEVVEED